jgi:hypothetical protein
MMENEEIDMMKKNQHVPFHLHCTLNINILNISILISKKKIFLDKPLRVSTVLALLFITLWTISIAITLVECKRRCIFPN